jgi:RNA 2',3'-cyclic 3'-phosphodiesterase
MPRLFFALWPDESVRDELHRAAQLAHQSAGGRLMRRDNLHQTLVFIGEIAEKRKPDLSAVASNIEAKLCQLQFGTVGYWRHNHIVWAAPVTTPAPLAQLVSALEAGLSAAGVAYDSRPYSPHVTLVRDAHRRAPLPSICFDWLLRDFVLVESVHDTRGAVYRVIERWPLIA